MTRTLPLILPALLVLSACTREPAAPVVADAANASQRYRIQAWSLPVSAVAAQPDLIATPDGRLLLSWVEPQSPGHAMKFAGFDGTQWMPPRTIAQGSGWFVNWADTPHLAATGDGALWAHWLQKSADATYAYDVVMVRSDDAGAHWSTPVRVNTDGKAAEHGFVSMWPAHHDALGVAWLDGREAASAAASGHDAHGEHGGAMTLRTATFDGQLQRRSEMRLDAMACDCCQTDAAMTARGPLLVFRDRTPDEIRDIAVSRQDGENWTTPRIVHDDRWKMPACPVNGPAVAASGNEVVVGWYTAAGDTPTLKLARSTDAGDRFAAPVTLDQGEAVQGRVDVALDGDGAWALWLREDGKGQSLQLARYAPDLSRELQRIQVATLQGRGRGTGFPQLALHEGRPHVVWTDVIDGKPQLRGATLTR